MMRRLSAWVGIAALAATTAVAQDNKPTGKLHGHVQNEIYQPLANMKVALGPTGDPASAKISFPTDADGDYKATDVPVGTYFVTLISPDGKSVDQLPNIKVIADQDLVADFDLSREEYVKKESPERQKAIEDARKKNADALKSNAAVSKLNDQLKAAREANKAKNYAVAETNMQQATQTKPDASVLWLELGVAQNGLGKEDDAITSLQKAVDLENASKKPNVETIAAANNLLGEAYGKQGKAEQSSAAYDAAAKANPAQAGTYYTNEAIIMRGKNGDAVVAAADKAIAADPNKSIAYYLKAESLVNKASVDPKTQKIVLPPGCEDAYQKYLELEPNGQFAAAAKAVLQESGSTVNSSYKASKKK